MSTPCSAAIFRTSGDDRVRTRSSNEAPLDDGDGLVAAGTDRWGAAACLGADSDFGGGPPLSGNAVFALPVSPAGAVAAAVTSAPFSVSSLATTVCMATV